MNSHSNTENQVEPDSILIPDSIPIPDSILISDFETNEKKIIKGAKKNIYKALMEMLKIKVDSGEIPVYNIVELLLYFLKEHSIHRFFKIIAESSCCGYYNNSNILFFQYKYLGNPINIIAVSDIKKEIVFEHGYINYTCPDKILFESLISPEIPTETIFEKLKQDIKTKFDSIYFFSDFQKACDFIKNYGQGHSGRVFFSQNPKLLEKKRAVTNNRREQCKEKILMKRKKKEELKRFGNYAVPTHTKISDFVPKI